MDAPHPQKFERGHRAVIRTPHENREALRSGRPHPDLLGVDEFFDAMGAELAAIAGFLDAAGRKARVGFDDAVDGDLARFDLAGDLFAPSAPRPDAGGKPIRRVIGKLERAFFIRRFDERGDGAEGFFLKGAHAGGDIGK
mgnify:CR=1 FL=1